jgi:hypothetical protein
MWGSLRRRFVPRGGAQGFDWPYTLDSGTSPRVYPGKDVGSYPGFWELPVTDFIPETGYVTIPGFDWNVWCSKKLSKDEALALWKSTLKVHMNGDPARWYEGNRAPMFFGAHTDEYSDFNADVIASCAGTNAERRAAVEEFIDWALAYHPDVRIVTYADVLNWMQRPRGLDGTVAAPLN